MGMKWNSRLRVRSLIKKESMLISDNNNYSNTFVKSV